MKLKLKVSVVMSDIKGSKLLRGNWVEAQSTQHLDEDIPEGHTTSKKVSKEGHKGLLAEDAELKETTSSTKGFLVSFVS